MKDLLFGTSAGIAAVVLGFSLPLGLNALFQEPSSSAPAIAQKHPSAAPHKKVEHVLLGAKSAGTTAAEVSAHAGDPVRGKEQYMMHCSACHQPEGEGKIGLAPSIRNRDFLALASDDFIRTTIRKGRLGTAMIPRADLDDQTVNDMIAYFRALPVAIPLDVSVDPSLTFAGDAERGGHSYGLYCASCHGPQGEGYAAGGAGPGIGLKGFLSTASDDYIFKTIKYGRMGTAMRPFLGAEGLANLDEQEAKDIIVYLRANAGGAAPAVVADASNAPGDPVKGETHYLQNCAACHQLGGEGKTGLAPSIRNRDFLALASDDFIRDTIVKGRLGTAMIGRPDLAGKVNDIIAYLRDIDVVLPLNVKVDPHLVLSGNASAGSEKYSLFCASCHGPQGEGYSAGGSGPGIGLPGFLATAGDDYILQTVRYGRIGTAMRPFIGAAGLANLSEEDVGDIIAHLRDQSK